MLALSCLRPRCSFVVSSKVLKGKNVQSYLLMETTLFVTKPGCEWTDCIVDKILKKVEIGEFITTALKSILKLVKLQSFVAKRCKMWKM